jgi:serine phosphatase RsbU (regulator of sigma subunit)
MSGRHFDEVTGAPATDVALSEWNLRDVLATIRERLRADVVTVLQLDPASRHLVTVFTESSTRGSPGHHRVPVGRGLAGRVAELGSAIVLDDVGEDDLVNPALLSLGVRSLLAVPIWHGHQLTGVLKVGSRERRHFSGEQVATTQALADEVSTALQSYFAADERAAAAALQRSLVPSSLPDIEGLDLAGRYVPGQGGVSGDWYDVFALPGGRLGLVMGDVAGHGLQASVVMGRLRSALRAYSLEYDDPAEVLSHLDAKIVHFEPGAMATVVYAVTEPPFGVIRISSAGHLAPILLAADGSSRTAEVPVSLPLGVDTATRRASAEVRLEDHAVLVLYTDGLLERRSTSTPRSHAVFGSIRSALDELRRNLVAGPADEIASRVLDSMLTIEPPVDDVALLVVRRTASDEESSSDPLT